jgi:hypothetical protein
MGSCESIDERIKQKGFRINTLTNLKMMENKMIFASQRDDDITMISIKGDKSLFLWKGYFPILKEDVVDIIYYTKYHPKYNKHYIVQMIYKNQLYISLYNK